MSEFQYYEWQTLDRPLTHAEMEAVKGLSSHIDVTSTRAQVDYQWGNFRHDPHQILARYFDAFLYFANWGDQTLAFRFPAGLLDEEALRPYLWPSCVELAHMEGHIILTISYIDEDGDSEVDFDAELAWFTPLRDEILAGDLRVLYLAWLMSASVDDMDDTKEPPVPAGLATLTATQETFIRFFG